MSQFLHPKTGKHTQLGSPGFWSGSPVVGEEANLGTGLGTDPEFSPEPALSFQPGRMGLIAPGVVCPRVQIWSLNGEGLGVTRGDHSPPQPRGQCSFQGPQGPGSLLLL